MNNYPKILIFGQPFNDFSGGGITLTNLFKGWPKDRIAVAFIPYLPNLHNIDFCSTYYQIGRDEYKWCFPFNLYKRPFPPSGLITEDNTNRIGVSGYSRTIIKPISINKVFNSIINWLGLNHCDSKITLSNKFKDWLTAFQPDIIYFQVSNYNCIVFVLSLLSYLKIPSVIHIMDDWPSIIGGKGLFSVYWEKKIINKFKILLDRVDLYLSICDNMSEEYKSRYGKEFFAFHNTIDLKFWLPYRKLEYDIEGKEINVLFSGRIGPGIEDSLSEVASAIEILWKMGNNIKLHIQTRNYEHAILTKIQKYSCVIIDPPVDYCLMPKIFANADILIIANDFNEDGIKYLKFSMPTKVPEYMISGTPILVYSSAETAVSKFFRHNNCGYCVTSHNIQEIVNALDFLIRNPGIREKISFNAVNYAKEKFDGERVRSEFQNLLVALLKREKQNSANIC